MNEQTFKRFKDDVQKIISCVQKSGVDYIVDDIDSRKIYDFVNTGEKDSIGWNFLQIGNDIMFTINFTTEEALAAAKEIDLVVFEDYSGDGLPVAICYKSIGQYSIPCIGNTIEERLMYMTSQIPFDPADYMKIVLNVDPDLFPKASLKECRTAAQCKKLYESIKSVLS